MATATKAKQETIATIEFAFEKATKNTFRFQEVTEGNVVPTIGTIWVQKSAFVSQPSNITIEVKA